jgi:uncharacterized protein (DUF2141 family)
MTTLMRTLAAAALAGAALAAFTPQPLVFAAQGLQAASEAAAPARVTHLTVHVDGAASDAGRIWVGLYNGPDAFDAGDEIASANLTAVDGAAQTVFEGLAPGEYGIIAFHDADGDGDFTRNFIGIPQERYGFSNNPRPRFRNARWDEAVFVLDEAGEIHVELVGASG